MSKFFFIIVLLLTSIMTYAQKKFKTCTVNGVTFNMIIVKGGSFDMGATFEQGEDAIFRELPVHNVAQRSFRIAETEVTNALWKAVMGNVPSLVKDNNMPVENVSYNDCIDFINKLNKLTGRKFRLPTEAEWEFAARGGRLTKFSKFPGGNNASSVGWFDYNSRYQVHAVKTKASNELGIYDMGGNVWEWCSDFYSEYTSKSQDCPTGPKTGIYRVIRGGSWNSGEFAMRVSYRYAYYPGTPTNNIGLRLAENMK